MFKIALNAGHYFYEPGRRVLKQFDEKESREWVLNSRVAEKVEEILKGYTGYTLLRTDDRTGEKLITLVDRIKKVNDFGADIYVSIHHNGGIYGGSGGGIMAYTYLYVNEYTKNKQKLLYNKLIEKTGLVGNRATPLATADFYECRETKMPAVLLELGFMDSSTDAPIIITEDYSKKCAQAIAEAIIELGNLVKKEEPKETELYRVQVGAYKNLTNAQKTVEKLKQAGFNAIIKKEKI